MITEKEKDKLAELNGYSKERYEDKVKDGIKDSEYDKDKENAIMRKLAKAMLDKIVYGIDIPYDVMSEFKKYYECIENIKYKSKNGEKI